MTAQLWFYSTPQPLAIGRPSLRTAEAGSNKMTRSQAVVFESPKVISYDLWPTKLVNSWHDTVHLEINEFQWFNFDPKPCRRINSVTIMPLISSQVPNVLFCGQGYRSQTPSWDESYRCSNISKGEFDQCKILPNYQTTYQTLIAWEVAKQKIERIQWSNHSLEADALHVITQGNVQHTETVS